MTNLSFAAESDGHPQIDPVSRGAGDAERWNAAEYYGTQHWGDGYFGIDGSGRLFVHPSAKLPVEIPVEKLLHAASRAGVEPPILFRFGDIIGDRIDRLASAFSVARTEHAYRGNYWCVYPIKVNQQESVVSQFIDRGHAAGFGLEVGSKPELLIALSMAPIEMPIICNGFKDAAMMRMILSAQKSGRTIYPVLEKVNEADVLLREAAVLEVIPRFGMRVRLAARGSGRWGGSLGYTSKFGLTITQIHDLCRRLEDSGALSGFELLHIHPGSQIGDIRELKSAMIEAARIYVDLVRRGVPLSVFDAGGGLGVDYTGLNRAQRSSTNYDIREYASDVIWHFATVCDEAGVPHPDIITESGRYLMAHHAILVVDQIGSITPAGNAGGNSVDGQRASEADEDLAVEMLTDNSTRKPTLGPLDDLRYAAGTLSRDREVLTDSMVREAFHDAGVALNICVHLFSAGHMSLDDRVLAERLYFFVCRRCNEITRNWDPADRQPFEFLSRLLADIRYLNFSIFQSLPDAWAIDQLFPVMPIAKLNETPTRVAVMADITCDSDGKLDNFVTSRRMSHTLRLPDYREPETPIAVLMVGAYQETLGDLHNLFGDTAAIEVETHDTADGSPSWRFSSISRGDRVRDCLRYVGYDPERLASQYRTRHETDGRLFDSLLDDTSYLHPDDRSG